MIKQNKFSAIDIWSESAVINPNVRIPENRDLEIVQIEAAKDGKYIVEVIKNNGQTLEKKLERLERHNSDLLIENWDLQNEVHKLKNYKLAFGGVFGYAIWITIFLAIEVIM